MATRTRHYTDRADAGRVLAGMLRPFAGTDAVVVGLARGGVEVAAVVAAELDLPLDALAVRKVGHPQQPELALGAVTRDITYLREYGGLRPNQLRSAADAARRRARQLDRLIHDSMPWVDVAGRPCVLVDDGLATGATMIAAVRWARFAWAARAVVAVPVASVEAADLLKVEADEVVCPLVVSDLWGVGAWYGDFGQVPDQRVLELLRAARERRRPPGRGSS